MGRQKIFKEPRIKLSVRVSERQRDNMLKAILITNDESIKTINDYMVDLMEKDLKGKGII